MILTKIEVLELIKNNSDNISTILKYQYPDTYNFIKFNYLNTKDIRFTEKIYQYVYDIFGICKNDNCNNICIFKRISSGYCDYCSPKCKSSSLVIKEKTKLTNIQKYGHQYTFQSNEIVSKGKNSILLKYGVKNVFQNKDIQEKSKQSKLKRYGFEHQSQNPEYAQKLNNRLFKRKSYILPSGNIIELQGFENYALDILLQTLHEEEIITTYNKMPEIWYLDSNNKKHKYFPDIFLPNQKKFIEVKSTYTYNKSLDTIHRKCLSVISLGYDIEIWIISPKKSSVTDVEIIRVFQ